MSESNRMITNFTRVALIGSFPTFFVFSIAIFLIIFLETYGGFDVEDF